jgi:hypothetical protein
MSHRHHETVDLLEIYHGRELRRLILAQLRRLRSDENGTAGPDPERRNELCEHYGALLIGTDELLRSLGDVPAPYQPG